MIGRGEFRADLSITASPATSADPAVLRERLEDVLPLALSFIQQMQPDRQMPTLDPMVRTICCGAIIPGTCANSSR